MPPHYHTAGRPRTSTRQISSSYNALGYDPDGRVTHLVQHVFGAWVPHITHRARFTGRHCIPPRYGPPTAEQIPWLPIAFIPQDPPLYYGLPCAPYLPPPLSYNAAVFSALISRPRARQIDGELLEAAPGGTHCSHLLWDGHLRHVYYHFSLELRHTLLDRFQCS